MFLVHLMSLSTTSNSDQTQAKQQIIKDNLGVTLDNTPSLFPSLLTSPIYYELASTIYMQSLTFSRGLLYWGPMHWGRLWLVFIASGALYRYVY